VEGATSLNKRARSCTKVRLAAIDEQPPPSDLTSCRAIQQSSECRIAGQVLLSSLSPCGGVVTKAKFQKYFVLVMVVPSNQRVPRCRAGIAFEPLTLWRGCHQSEIPKILCFFWLLFACFCEIRRCALLDSIPLAFQPLGRITPRNSTPQHPPPHRHAHAPTQAHALLCAAPQFLRSSSSSRAMQPPHHKSISSHKTATPFLTFPSLPPPPPHTPTQLLQAKPRTTPSQA